MHAFMLILVILGQPERAVAICDTYKKCDAAGAVAAEHYANEGGTPRNFSYRIIAVIITPEPTT